MALGRLTRGFAVAVFVVGTASLVAARNVTLTLTPTVKAPTAKGRTTLAVKRHGRGKFAVLAKKLAPGGSFDVIVGGVKVGGFTTNAAGGGRLKFSTNPRGNQAMLGFDPRGQEIVVREDDGDDDLVGDMPEDGDSASGACCIPGHHEDGETECEDMTADECTTHGGTPANTSSCLPNPCATTPPGGVICCIADSAHGAFDDEDPEVECENTSQAECALHGGSVVTATSCEPNPCVPTPPTSQVACCAADEGEMECELRTSESCTANGGIPSGNTCDPNPCVGGGGDSGGDGGSGHD